MTIDVCDVARAVASPTRASSGLITGWSVDSRTVQPGDLFFALRGPSHDGHHFLPAAFERGAAAAVADRGVESPGLVLRVQDTLRALQDAARWARESWGGAVVAVTGSAGKTTTKDVIAHLLGSEMAVGKTVGNFNNHVGLPLSILRLPDGCQTAVLEIGMNHAGEIRDLACLCRPSIGVVTNVGYAHVENFDSIEGVALAKRELIEALPPDGVAVLNADDPRVARFGEVHPGLTITFGLSEAADLRAEDVQSHGDGVAFRVGTTRFESTLAGRHGVLNILAGLAVGRAFGIPPERFRESARTLAAGRRRGERFLHRDVTVIDDCYNSNPEAARLMLDLLRETPARRRIAVLGEMLELGNWSARLHRELGRYAAESGIPVVIGIRGAARHLVEAARQAGLADDAARFFETSEEAGEELRRLARPGDAILFKGSRGTRVEDALERFLA